MIDGPDLSFDAHLDGSRHLDEFGHGTHMAGIIAGRDAEWSASDPLPGQFAGVAPEAQLLNMKVGAGDGGVDVSQVIAALDWVVEHRDAGGMDVRVVSLAYGTVSLQPWQVDPLARAVENAWRAGIVVVASAGNDGLETDHLLMPALSPHILAVGAVDPRSTDERADDVVADFTNGGNADRRPDVVAPGRSVVSLRVPGSYADVTSPEGRVEGDLSERFFRGSGTSQATAFVAGQVALLLQERPELTPDQVKTLLMSTAQPLAGDEPAMGAGVPDVLAAVAAPAPAADAPPPDLPFSSGLGSLDAARGDARVVDPDTGSGPRGRASTPRASPGTRPPGWPPPPPGRRGTAGSWNGRTWTGDEFVDGSVGVRALDRQLVVRRDLGGPARGRVDLGGPQLAQRRVGGPQLARGLVGGPQLAPGLLGGPQLAPGQLGGPQLASWCVTTVPIQVGEADDSVGRQRLDDAGETEMARGDRSRPGRAGRRSRSPREPRLLSFGLRTAAQSCGEETLQHVVVGVCTASTDVAGGRPPGQLFVAIARSRRASPRECRD